MTEKILVIPEDDGLPYDEVGSWAEDKHALVGLYDRLFSTGMKNKWDARVYIDLYAGPGLLRIRDTQKFIWGSPILALNVKDRFDKYVFCESKPESIEALRERVQRHFAGVETKFIHGNCDERTDEICDAIPKATKDFRVLSFCFIDPYDLSIQFSTLAKIANRFVDFLVLLALNMDANRNRAYYLDPGNTKIDKFLGLADWRQRWERSAQKSFPRFLAEEYAKQMTTLGYLPLPFEKMKQVRSDVRNLPLYHLALFSRHERAYKYWNDVLKYSNPQTSMWD
jgi:three-Cys-motif partner protein